jgi:hypothetical protein
MMSLVGDGRVLVGRAWGARTSARGAHERAGSAESA